MNTRDEACSLLGDVAKDLNTIMEKIPGDRFMAIRLFHGMIEKIVNRPCRVISVVDVYTDESEINLLMNLTESAPADFIRFRVSSLEELLDADAIGTLYSKLYSLLQAVIRKEEYYRAMSDPEFDMLIQRFEQSIYEARTILEKRFKIGE